MFDKYKKILKNHTINEIEDILTELKNEFNKLDNKNIQDKFINEINNSFTVIENLIDEIVNFNIDLINLKDIKDIIDNLE